METTIYKNLKLVTESPLNEKELLVFDAIRQMMELYQDDFLEDFYNAVKEVTFEDYVISGIGGNHVWIARKSDGKRIAIVIEK